MNVGVIVPAAGAGERLGGRAKPFVTLAGEPMLVHALRPFLADGRVSSVVVALHPAEARNPPAWLATLDPRIRLTRGGRERGDSVRAALEAVPSDIEAILIHDAARPLVTPALVDRAIDAVVHGRSAAVGVRMVDTVHEVDERGRINATLDRSRLWRAQTPQAFPRAILVEAHRQAAVEGEHATDDAALVARTGEPVHLIDGDPENLKVTTPADLVVAEAVLRSRAR